MDKVEEEDSNQADDDIAIEKSEHGLYSISDVSSTSGNRLGTKSVKSRQSKRGSRRKTNNNRIMMINTGTVK